MFHFCVTSLYLLKYRFSQHLNAKIALTIIRNIMSSQLGGSVSDGPRRGMRQQEENPSDDWQKSTAGTRITTVLARLQVPYPKAHETFHMGLVRHQDHYGSLGPPFQNTPHRFHGLTTVGKIAFIAAIFFSLLIVHTQEWPVLARPYEPGEKP